VSLTGRWLAIGLFGLSLIVLHGVGLFFQTQGNFDGVIDIMLAEGVVYLAAVGCLGRVDSSRATLLVILAIALLLRIVTLALPPYLSSDIYRYIWDGRVQAAGINPYRYIPADDALAALRDSAIYPNINRATYAHTIYPPAAEMLFFLVTRVSEQLTAMKLAMLAFDLATIGLILSLLRNTGAPLSRVLIYAWHPLGVWEIAGSGHIDAAMIFCLALALLARQRGWLGSSGIALALGTLVKFLPVTAAPALYRRRDWRMPTAFVATIVVLYLPYLAVGKGALGFLPVYLQEERLTSGSGFYLPSLVSFLTGIDLPAGPYLAVAAAILGAAALFVLFRRSGAQQDAVNGALILALVFFLLVTPHYPWYFLWLLPLLCLQPWWPAILLTAMASALYFVLEERSAARELLVNSVLYGAFLLAVGIQLCVHRRQPAMARQA
jgi:alpha-1,6-mannosyltransferase